MGIDEMKGRLGMELEPAVYEIEKGTVQRFVQAIGDSNPRWQVTVPPTFVLTIGLGQIQQLLTSDSSVTLLHGSTELECYRPISLGDVLTATAKITNVRERQGKMGKSAFVTIDTNYENQKQELVARSRQLLIMT